MEMIAIEQLRECAGGTTTYQEYAARVAEIDPVLGVCERMSADAHEDDGRGGDVKFLPEITMTRIQRMMAAGITTINEAARWWPVDQLGLSADDPAVDEIARPYCVD